MTRPYYQAGVFSQYGYLDMYPGSIPRVEADALIVQNARTFFVGNAPVVSDVDGQGFSKRWFAVAKETWADVRNVDSLLDGIRAGLEHRDALQRFHPRGAGCGETSGGLPAFHGGRA